MKIYKKIPSIDELQKDLDQFLHNNKEKFPGKVKIGKTVLEHLENCYQTTDKYEQLTAAHIFGKCTGEKLALHIEKMCQQYLCTKDLLLKGTDEGERSLSKNSNWNFAIYVTNEKPKDQECVFCNRYYASERQKKHMANEHIHYIREWEKVEKAVKDGYVIGKDAKELLGLTEKYLKWWKKDADEQHPSSDEEDIKPSSSKKKRLLSSSDSD